jgi:predicted phosphoadenosine phosphosulfate sulfurtransferase
MEEAIRRGRKVGILLIDLEAQYKLTIDHAITMFKMYADNRYNWGKVTQQWVDLLTQLKQQYNSTDSRKIPKEMFTYRA